MFRLRVFTHLKITLDAYLPQYHSIKMLVFIFYIEKQEVHLNHKKPIPYEYKTNLQTAVSTFYLLVHYFLH
jgi:hypothetical protein